MRTQRQDRPRAAVAQEIRAYAAWLASKAGLYPFNASEVIGGGIAWRSRHNEPVMGVTYGEQRGRNAETREYEYEPGSYSIPFPGRNAHRDKVTFETLDDDGNVIASSCLPVEPKRVASSGIGKQCARRLARWQSPLVEKWSPHIGGN